MKTRRNSLAGVICLTIALSFFPLSGFAQGFGNGSDGARTVSNSSGEYTDLVRARVTLITSFGLNTTLTLNNQFGTFGIGDLVIVIQMESATPSDIGKYTVASVNNVGPGTIDVNVPGVAPVLTGAGGDRVQVLKIYEYTNLTMAENSRLECNEWDGNTGGILIFACDGTLTWDAPTTGQPGLIDASEKGYLGTAIVGSGGAGDQGELGGDGGDAGTPAGGDGDDGLGFPGSASNSAGLCKDPGDPNAIAGSSGGDGGSANAWGTNGTAGSANYAYPSGSYKTLLMMGKAGANTGDGGIAGGPGGPGGGGGRSGASNDGVAGENGYTGGTGGNGGAGGRGGGAVYIRAASIQTNSISGTLINVTGGAGQSGEAGQGSGSGGKGGKGGDGGPGGCVSGVLYAGGGGGGGGYRGNGSGGGDGGDGGSAGSIWVAYSNGGANSALADSLVNGAGGAGGGGGEGANPYPTSALGGVSPIGCVTPCSTYAYTPCPGGISITEFHDCACWEVYCYFSDMTTRTHNDADSMVYTDGSGNYVKYWKATATHRVLEAYVHNGSTAGTCSTSASEDYILYRCYVAPSSDCDALIGAFTGSPYGSCSPGSPGSNISFNSGSAYTEAGGTKKLYDATYECFAACDPSVDGHGTTSGGGSCTGDCPLKGPNGSAGTAGSSSSLQLNQEDPSGSGFKRETSIMPGLTAGTYFQLAPNPARNELNISFSVERAGLYLFTVVDAAGREVLRQKYEAKAGDNRTTLGLYELPAGTYILKARNNMAESQVQFIKQ